MMNIDSTNQHRSTTDESSDRVATQRARYLSRTTDLRNQEGLALGYREQGYSQAAIARAMDSTKPTIANYMNRIVAQYGLKAIETKLPSDRGELTPVTERQLEQLSGRVRIRWFEIAINHLDRVPDAVDLDRFRTVGEGGQRAAGEGK